MQLLRRNNDAAHVRAEPTDILGQAVHDNIRAMIERPLTIGGSEGVINDNADWLLPLSIYFFYDPAHSGDVDELQRGIHWRLEVHHPRAFVDSGTPCSFIRQVNKTSGNVISRQPIGQQTIGTAVHDTVSNNLLSALYSDAESGADSRHTSGKANRCFTAFSMRQGILQHAASWLIQAVININRL